MKMSVEKSPPPPAPAEAAYDCGFSNLANFNRQFRLHHRMTPKEYRKVRFL